MPDSIFRTTGIGAEEMPFCEELTERFLCRRDDLPFSTLIAQNMREKLERKAPESYKEVFCTAFDDRTPYRIPSVDATEPRGGDFSWRKSKSR